MTNYLPILADRILNTPLFMHPAKAETIFAVLEGRISLGNVSIGVDQPVPASPEASRFIGNHGRKTRRGSMVRAAGPTAVITIDGSLVNRGAWLNTNSGLVSYEGIAAQIDDAERDPEIKSVILDINSYGGEATGMFALAESIRKLRRSKYVVAVVNDVAASAGYGIASAADRIMISPTSMVGSVGVLMIHLDRSGELAAKGVRPTIIFVGDHKADGNPFGPLPESVRADMQRDAMAFYDRFIETVGAGRGTRLNAAAARKTQARVFIGADAIRAGLADGVASVAETLDEIDRRAKRAKPNPTKSTKGPTMYDKTYTAEELRAAVQADRARIKSVMELPEAKGRETQAVRLALSSDMSAGDAQAILADMPTASAPKTPTIEQRAAGQEEIGPGGALGQASQTEAVATGWKKAFAGQGGVSLEEAAAINARR